MKYRAREFRDNLAKALDEADRGEPVIIERKDGGGGNMRAKAKKTYTVKRREDSTRRPSTKPQES